MDFLNISKWFGSSGSDGSPKKLLSRMSSSDLSTKGGIHTLEWIRKQTGEESNEIFRKLDNRLFSEHLLYCEGMPRPKFRGLSHALCCFILPIGYYYLYLEAYPNPYAIISAIAYIGTNLFCCVISALYHMGKWSPRTEIFLQKVDHCGIAICTAGTYYPMAMTLLSYPVGVSFAGLATLTALWAGWNIFHGRPGVWRLMIIGSLMIIYLPIFCLYYITLQEFLSIMGNCLFQFIGAMIFINQWPDPFPNIFGYHEVFHVFTIVGFFCVYLANWSILHRACHPEAMPNVDPSQYNIIEIVYDHGLFPLVEYFMSLSPLS